MTMIDVKRRVLIWVAKVCITTSLYPGLFCVLLRFWRGGFCSLLLADSPSDLIRLPRWGVLSREMRVPVAPNRRRNGIGDNDERCNTSLVRSHVSFPFPSSYPRSFRLSFSLFNIQFNRPPSFLFGAERFRVRIRFSFGKVRKRDASKFFDLSSFRIKTF